MKWSERMGLALDYIEGNLTGEIDYHEAARRAACSTYHFQRMFLFVTGVTLGEYIRRRRLTLAAGELSSGNTKVIDVALKYGYDSPDAFTRAFRNVHGVTPLASREPGVSLVAYPRISFQIVLKGGKEMDYRIIEKPAFEIMGVSRKFTTVQQQNFAMIPVFWKEFTNSGKCEFLAKLIHAKPGKVTGVSILGVCLGDPGVEDFYYAIGVEKPAGAVPTGYEVFSVPASTWAVFEAVGPLPGSVQKVTQSIFDEWFPSTGYEHAAAPELEVYLDEDTTKPDYHSQVWIPVKKKN